MAAWLAAGARSIRPLAGVEAAREAAAEARALLVGERGGRAPEGFDFGNSPREAGAVGAGRELVMTTTNGTRALHAASGARAVFAAALVNGAAVAARLRSDHPGVPLVLVLAGTGEDFALEDAVGAAHLLRLLGRSSPWVHVLPDGADVAERLRQTRNGRNLERLGFGADIAWCARRDVLEVVPVLRGGLLVAG